jgi:hypothetical protein
VPSTTVSAEYNDLNENSISFHGVYFNLLVIPGNLGKCVYRIWQLSKGNIKFIG